jgi:glucosamine--fructose-6-phosphate aminotransferase (isomerizing)
VIAALLDSELATGQEPLAALKATLDQLVGAYALACWSEARRLIMGARRGSPLVVGYGDGEMFIGSDGPGRRPLHRPVSIWRKAISSPSHHRARHFRPVGPARGSGPVRTVPAPPPLLEKGKLTTGTSWRKEILDQPEGCQNTISAYVDAVSGRTAFPET